MPGAPVGNGGRPGRPEGPLDPAAGAASNLAAGLRKLREEAGRPSYRQLARLAYYSHSALSQAASGRELPSLPVTLAFVQACGGDRREWTARWEEAAAEAGVLAGPDTHPADAMPAADTMLAVSPGPAVEDGPAVNAKPVAVRRPGWQRLAAAGLAGAAAGILAWGVASLTATSVPHVTGGLTAPVADGDYPSVADCGGWTKDLGGRRVLDGNGHLVGTIQLRYSMRCGAVWARFDPRKQALASAGTLTVTVEVTRQPDDKSMVSREPYAGHLARSDILLLHGGCAKASVTLARPGQTLGTGATACQPPP